jgi:hypothetical protein
MEDAMHDSRRYRDSAAECLLAAQEACQPYHRKLHLSMAASWLSLARQDEAIDNLLARWDSIEARDSHYLGNHIRPGMLGSMGEECPNAQANSQKTGP